MLKDKILSDQEINYATKWDEFCDKYKLEPVFN